MSAKTQHNNILLAVMCFVAVVAAVALIGFFTMGKEDNTLQGEVEVGEYRVSGKVPGRISEIRVKEGDFVKKGDTLAVIEAPELVAKQNQAEGAAEAAGAMSDMAAAGARKEQVAGAYQQWRQAAAGLEISLKSYERVQRLFDQGVVTEQKRDEALAAYKAMEAQEKAAESQYQMAKNGAREEERRAAKAQARRAEGAMREVEAYIGETVLTAADDGEVSDVFVKVGELVGAGSPIMSVALMEDVWGVFNIREDMLVGMKVGDNIDAYVPAFGKHIRLTVCNIKDAGNYAVWKSTKASGRYDLRTFEVKARPADAVEGLRPGMSLVVGLNH